MGIIFQKKYNITQAIEILSTEIDESLEKKKIIDVKYSIDFTS